MKIKLIILVLILVGFVSAIGAIQQPRSLEWQRPKGPGTLDWRAQQAKEEGTKQVIIYAPIGMLEEIRDLEDALSRFTVVLAELTEQKSFPDSDNTDIRTWNKFKVIEIVSQKNRSHRTSPVDVPQELLPLAENELLVPRNGGTLIVDGIKIISKDGNFPQFSVSKTYLLFLNTDFSNSGKIGLVTIGPSAVFSVTSNNVLEPFVKGDNGLERDMKAIYDNSLDRLRKAMKQGSGR